MIQTTSKRKPSLLAFALGSLIATSLSTGATGAGDSAPASEKTLMGRAKEMATNTRVAVCVNALLPDSAVDTATQFNFILNGCIKDYPQDMKETLLDDLKTRLSEAHKEESSLKDAVGMTGEQKKQLEKNKKKNADTIKMLERKIEKIEQAPQKVVVALDQEIKATNDQRKIQKLEEKKKAIQEIFKGEIAKQPVLEEGTKQGSKGIVQSLKTGVKTKKDQLVADTCKREALFPKKPTLLNRLASNIITQASPLINHCVENYPQQMKDTLDTLTADKAEQENTLAKVAQELQTETGTINRIESTPKAARKGQERDLKQSKEQKNALTQQKKGLEQSTHTLEQQIKAIQKGAKNVLADLDKRKSKLADPKNNGSKSAELQMISGKQREIEKLLEETSQPSPATPLPSPEDVTGMGTNAPASTPEANPPSPSPAKANPPPPVTPAPPRPDRPNSIAATAAPVPSAATSQPARVPPPLPSATTSVPVPPSAAPLPPPLTQEGLPNRPPLPAPLPPPPPTN